MNFLFQKFMGWVTEKTTQMTFFYLIVDKFYPAFKGIESTILNVLGL